MMSGLIYFGLGAFAGAVCVADILGYRLARMGDPFWQGWMRVRSWGLFK